MDYLYKLRVKVIFQNNFQVDLDKIFQLKGILLDAEEKIIASSNWTNLRPLCVWYDMNISFLLVLEQFRSCCLTTWKDQELYACFLTKILFTDKNFATDDKQYCHLKAVDDASWCCSQMNLIKGLIFEWSAFDMTSISSL